MKVRILIGAVLLLVMGGLFVLDGLLESRRFVSGLIIVTGCVAWYELAALTGAISSRRGGGVALFLVGLAGTAYFLWLGCWGPVGEGSGCDRVPLETAGVAGLLLAAFAATVLRGEPRERFVPLLVTILGALLCGFLFSYVGRIYRHEHGIWLGVFFLLGVKGNDISAYFVGTRLGRRRWIAVSPKKTVEGCLGALLFSCTWFTCGALLAPFPLFPWPVGLALGAALSGAAQLGDLSESLVKRFYSAKDSGRVLPEFGGVLDLVDSFLYCGFIFWLFLPV